MKCPTGYCLTQPCKTCEKPITRVIMLTRGGNVIVAKRKMTLQQAMAHEWKGNPACQPVEFKEVTFK